MSLKMSLFVSCFVAAMTMIPSSAAALTCPAGHYCAPTPCPCGRYCPANVGNSTVCPAGTFCPSKASAPTNCPAGSYCTAASCAAKPCLVGYYCPGTRLSQAKLCPAGYYCPRNSLTLPLPCPSKQFQPKTGQSACSNCTIWKCPTGKYSTNCTAIANSVCASCTNTPPTNGVYLSAGTTGMPKSCKTGCAADAWLDSSKNACSPCQSLVFASIPGSHNNLRPPEDANIDNSGTYVRDPRLLNGEPIYINAAKSTFVGFSGYAWMIAGIESLDGLLAGGEDFPGIDMNWDPSVLLAWDSYTVSYSPSPVARGRCSSSWTCPSGYYLNQSSCASCQSVLTLVSKPDAINHGNCDGTYVLDPRLLNGQPIYINAAKNRFIGFARFSWIITGTELLNGLLAGGVFSGGFHFNSDPSVLQAWGSYFVLTPPGC